MKRKWDKIVFGLLIIAAILFYGPWLLNLFGLINYTPPISQSPENVVRIDLLDTETGEFRVLHSLTGEQIGPFLEDFLKLNAGKYANDPPTDFGTRTIKICYSDGGYDLLGDMIVFCSSDGSSLPVNGWYYLRRDELESLIDSYLP